MRGNKKCITETLTLIKAEVASKGTVEIPENSNYC